MTDPARGAGVERTTLAWQRTALALVAGSAFLSRLTFERLGVAALLSVVVAAPLGCWLVAASRTRSRRAPGSGLYARGGLAPALLTAATAAVAVTELLAVVSGSLD